MIFVVIGALTIGLSLGLLGSGGSAITVPVLVYLVGHHAKQSIAESMAIVGLISMIAAVPYAKSKQIDWLSVWYFGIPGMFGTFAGAWLGGLASEAVQLMVFGVVLVASAYALLRKPHSEIGRSKDQDDSVINRSPIWQIAIEGILVGILTGFVGVGGGFLIVPALVLLGGLPMRLAIGTSLVIIALKSAVGFAKYQQLLLTHSMSVDFQTVLTFVLIGLAGSLFGKLLNARMDQHLLKQLFAVFLVLLGGFVIVSEGSKLVSSSDSEPVHETSSTSIQRVIDPLPPPRFIRSICHVA